MIKKFGILYLLCMQFWFCEKTNITHPISGREGVEGQTPALIKWSLPELNAKMQQTAICDIQVRSDHLTVSLNNNDMKVYVLGIISTDIRFPWLMKLSSLCSRSKLGQKHNQEVKMKNKRKVKERRIKKR